MKKKVIIYDRLNNLVWVDGQKSAGKGRTNFYGRDARRFTTDSQTRKYASSLAKRQGGKVYDKYHGRYYTPKSSSPRRRVRRSSGPFGINFRF